MVADLGETGLLYVWGRDWNAELTFRDGRLVGARCGDCDGAAALAKLVAASPALDFKYTPASVAAESTYLDGSDAEPTGTSETVSTSATTSGSTVEGHTRIDSATPGRPTAALARRSMSMACPLLGFVDDPNNHLERPTSLHRCYASSMAPAIPYAEQADRCLSGQFASCPRFKKRTDAPELPTSELPRVAAAASEIAVLEQAAGWKKRVKEGFLPTVSIVMAVAALVLLIVFRAVPQAG
jgi:hypothetical protein